MTVISWLALKFTGIYRSLKGVFKLAFEIVQNKNHLIKASYEANYLGLVWLLIWYSCTAFKVLGTITASSTLQPTIADNINWQKTLLEVGANNPVASEKVKVIVVYEHNIIIRKAYVNFWNG